MPVFRNVLAILATTTFLTACIEQENNDNPESKSFSGDLANASWQHNYEFQPAPEANPDLYLMKMLHWTFNEDGTYRLITEIFDPEANYPSQTMWQDGYYALGSSLTTSGGLTAQKLDHAIVPFPSTDENFEVRPTLDVIYVSNDQLYFGKVRPLDVCEGEFYALSGSIDETQLIEDYLSNESLNNKDCYGRPDTINFDQAFIKVSHDLESQ